MRSDKSPFFLELEAVSRPKALSAGLIQKKVPDLSLWLTPGLVFPGPSLPRLPDSTVAQAHLGTQARAGNQNLTEGRAAQVAVAAPSRYHQCEHYVRSGQVHRPGLTAPGNTLSPVFDLQPVAKTPTETSSQIFSRVLSKENSFHVPFPTKIFSFSHLKITFIFRVYPSQGCLTHGPQAAHEDFLLVCGGGYRESYAQTFVLLISFR